MIQRAFINAFSAELYIVGLVLLINQMFESLPNEDTLVILMVMLSLLVLSVCVMGYFFVLQPVTRFLGTGLKEALQLFLYTIGIFAVFAFGMVLLLMMGIFT